MKKVNKEWFFTAPWGKVALVSWGDPSGTPVLLVHGRQDSVATFVPLLDYLPDSYHYVGLDFPGHGKSDPFPTGLMISRFHFLVTIDLTIQYLKWNKFIYLAHSLGSEQGLFYNSIYPNRISKFILLDPRPSLQRLQVHDHAEYYKTFYAEYYDHYSKYNKDDRVYSKWRAMEAVMKARGLGEKEAEVVLQRNMKCIGQDRYRLSWDRRLRLPAPPNYPPDYYSQIFTLHPVPMLVVSATNSQGYAKGIESVAKIMTHMKKTLRHFYEEFVDGNHDVHICNPAVVAKYVNVFLNTNFKAKI